MTKIRKIYNSVWEKWAKKSIFDQKRPNFGQKIENGNFPGEFFSPFFKRPKNRFQWQKSGKFIVAFGRNGPKRAFLAKNDQILAKNGQKVENENFRPKIFFAIF